jgi:hypothetical protein
LGELLSLIVKEVIHFMAYSFPLAKSALSRISTNLAQLQTVIQQLQQREQVNYQATQRKNQQESSNVQLIQQLNQLIRSCQMEIGQFSQSGFPTSAKARAQVPYQVPVSIASPWHQPTMTIPQSISPFRQVPQTPATFAAVEQVKKAMALMEQASFFARRAHAELGFVAPSPAQPAWQTWSKYQTAPPAFAPYAQPLAIPPQYASTQQPQPQVQILQ